MSQVTEAPSSVVSSILGREKRQIQAWTAPRRQGGVGQSGGHGPGRAERDRPLAPGAPGRKGMGHLPRGGQLSPVLTFRLGWRRCGQLSVGEKVSRARSLANSRLPQWAPAPGIGGQHAWRSHTPWSG